MKARPSRRKQSREYYIRNRESILIKSSLNQRTPRGRFNVYRNGARRRGLEFSLTFWQFMQFWNKPCWYCGRSIRGIGLDRIKNNEGYKIGNIIACCTRDNRMKRDMSHFDFMSMCLGIARNNEKRMSKKVRLSSMPQILCLG